MTSIFLSYSRADLALAKTLAANLADRGLSSVTLHAVDGPEEMSQGGPAHHDWRSLVTEALARADIAVLLLTPTSLTSHSARVEWTEAIANARRVIPVLADRSSVSDLPPWLATIQAVDLSSGLQLAVDAIAHAIKSAELKPRNTTNARLEYLSEPFPDVHTSLREAAFQIDLATNGFGGLFKPAPRLLHEAGQRGARIRVVLPDPDFLTAPSSQGRNLETATRSRDALEQLAHITDVPLTVRILPEPIPQFLLRVDDSYFIDPVASSRQPQRHGVLRVSRRGAQASLFDVLSTEYEALFEVARRLPGTQSPSATSTEEIRRLLASDRSDDLLRGAEMYLLRRGCEVTAAAPESVDLGYDFVVWDPEAGSSIVEVKHSKRPVSTAALRRLIDAAQATGTDRAWLITNSKLGVDARRLLEESTSYGIKLEVVTPDTLEQSDSAD